LNLLYVGIEWLISEPGKFNACLLADERARVTALNDYITYLAGSSC